MEPTIKIYVDTDAGPAIIASMEEFNTPGPYTVAGPGKGLAMDWLEEAYGAFGHHIGANAAPCDLHSAAMDLQKHPEDSIRFIKVEGEIKTYSDGLAEGEMP